MTEVLMASTLLLWIVVIILGLVVFALARQVGILHERVAPAGALMPTTGPKVGELTEAAEYRDLHGRKVQVGGAGGDGRPVLIMWISPTCPVCKGLVPTALSLAGHENITWFLPRTATSWKDTGLTCKTWDSPAIPTSFLNSSAYSMRSASCPLPS